MISINGKSLTIFDVRKVALDDEKVVLSASTIEAIENSHRNLMQKLGTGNHYYGINTGYGWFQSKKISNDQIQELNRNLIISHAIGAGEYLSIPTVRSAILVRANMLAKGYSGIRIEIIQTLIEMLNKQVTPCIKSRGSLGSSGDLCLLAQLALVFSKDGKQEDNYSGSAFFKDVVYDGEEAMKKAGIERLVLGPKEGLAIINGATFSAALAALIINDCEYLNTIADSAAACSLESLLGRSEPFNEKLHRVRGHAGQMLSANIIRKLIRGSEMINSGKQIQDAYSLRCIPQVHGAVMDAVQHTKSIIEVEINAATDNPLIFEDGEIISGGNFHGEPIGLGMDYLSMAIAELGAISERRIARLLDPNLNAGLPPMLVSESEQAGLQSGLMIPHYVAASLALENQRLASPDSVHSLPTSANQEDFNANSWNAVLKAKKITENTMRILTIELYIAAHALDLRIMDTNKKLGKGTRNIYQSIRNIVRWHKTDVLWDKEIDQLFTAVNNREILFANELWH